METFQFALVVWACTATIVALFEIRENKELLEMLGFQLFIMKKMHEDDMPDEMKEEMEEDFRP